MASDYQPPQPFQPYQPPADREFHIRSLALLVAAALQLQPVLGRAGGISHVLDDASKIRDWLRAP